MDEDLPQKALAYVVGQDISTFSVEELDESIASLKREIERLEQERATKGSTKSAAEALFRRS